ncbi:hypothetical protein [Clostridium haemolyticum]|uniref:hypothetical protein n=1 Tax=Clostridium haemolyticum TaxID=84025 RepID=UPI000AB13D27|nr:hypothetical protein [Clostridium haemolyticum]
MLSADYDFTIKSKKIFHIPVTLLNRVTDDGIVNFKDHILLPSLTNEQLSLNLIKASLP